MPRLVPYLAMVLSLTSALSAPGEQAAREAAVAIRNQILRSEVWNFGRVGFDQALERSFQLHNPGPEILEIQAVQLTPPLAVTSMSRVVQPGGTGHVDIRFGQPRTGGDFEGLIVIEFAGAKQRQFFRVQGRVVNPIDFDPIGAFFIAAFKGEPVQRSVEVTNYEAEPLQKPEIEQDSPNFRAALETLEPGRRYRLTVRTLRTAESGTARGVIRLITSSKQYPLIRIPVNTQVRNRVYTFPDSLSFGLIDVDELRTRPQDLPFLSRSITVYQRNGSDFQITPETNVPFLRLTKRQGDLKDRYEIVAEVIPEKLRSGRFDGYIRIKTNDSEFSIIDVPVVGEIKGDWLGTGDH